MIDAYVDRLERKLKYAGVRKEVEVWIKEKVFKAITISLALSLVLAVFYDYIYSILFFIIFPSLLATEYLLIELKIEERRENVERVLPDLLRMIAANISAGLTPIVALRTAAHPEFGVISQELRYITTRSMSADSMEEILDEIHAHIQSDLLDRVLQVFTVSIRSGGDIVAALQEVASDIQRIHELHDSLVANTSMYIQFLLFGMVITMPFLMAVSISMGQLIEEFVKLSVDLEGLALILIVITSISSSILIGIIRTGKRIEGVRYILPLMIASLGVYWISKMYIVPWLVGLSAFIPMV